MRLLRTPLIAFASVMLLVALSGCAALAAEPDATSAPLPTATPEQVIVVRPSETVSSPTPALTPEPAVTPEPTPFSIVWLSDTQSMCYHNKVDALGAMGQWIADQKTIANILYVVQTGDMVDNGFKPRQWENFEVCYNAFRDILPYIAVAGNHDIGVKLQDYEAYLARPNVRSIPRGNTFERGRAVYATFEAGGTKFLLLGAGWGSEEMAIPWMNRVLKTHSDYVAILLFHSYIHENGSYIGLGEQLFEQVVKPNPNVRLVLNGHVRGMGAHFEDVDDNGDGVSDRRVTALFYNYQDAGNNCGQLRLLTFDPATRSIHVMTYSPYMQRLYRDEYFRAFEFDLPDSF